MIVNSMLQTWNIEKTLLLNELDSLQWPLGKLMIVLASRTLAKSINMSLLSDQELIRMKRYKCVADQERYLVAHGITRLICSILIGNPPNRLQFKESKLGKPYIDRSQLYFNISHSGNWVSLAFGKNVDLGVDIEQPQQKCDSLPFLNVYHPEENFDETDDNFYSVWTMKEAVTKATGYGLSIPFNELRLDYIEHSLYQCICMDMPWYIRHGILYDKTHLAVTSRDLIEIQHCFAFYEII